MPSSGSWHLLRNAATREFTPGWPTEVFRDGQPIPLTALEFDLLHALATHPGRVWTREQLIERVWGPDYFGDERVVDVHVKKLRRKLGDDPTRPAFIQTVRGAGYKFVDEPA